MVTPILSLTAVSLCIVSGEPHYRTFDMQKIDYQGVCKHLLVEPSSGFTGVNVFHVYLRNEYRGGNTQISFPRDVIVDVCGDHVEIQRDATSSAAVPVIVTVRMIDC
jgi:alpha-tectorin